MKDLLRNFFTGPMLVVWFLFGAVGAGIGGLFGASLVGLSIGLGLVLMVCLLCVLWGYLIMKAAEAVFKMLSGGN